MTRTSEVEQAVSRSVRDSLQKLQHSTEELNQAMNDLVSACGSARPANSLSSMLRAQTAAASLAASLEVLTRFVTSALQPEMRSPAEQETVSAVVPPPDSTLESPVEWRQPAPAAEPKDVPAAVPADVPVPDEAPSVTAPVISEAAMDSQPALPAEELRAADMMAEGSPVITKPVAQPIRAPEPAAISETPPVISEQALRSQAPESVEEQRSSDMEAEGSPVGTPLGTPVAPAPDSHAGAQEPPAHEVPASDAAKATVSVTRDIQEFEIAKLSPEIQELHRRANRVAKVSMQDIRMLRPNDVKLGKEHKDLCQRLRDDIERAHKEYDRRFQTILGHPVDYFYDWMVQILADGDPQALGEYPYPSSVLRH